MNLYNNNTPYKGQYNIVLTWLQFTVYPDHSMNHTHTVRYYFRAQYSYDPHYQSPNEEGLEEELAFSEGDVITVSCKSYIVTEVMAD